jgi:poly(3-hydroxybutyrate) depolymerase
MRGRWIPALLLVLAGVPAARGDEIVLRGGKTLRGYPIRQGKDIRLNTYGCSVPEMTLGVQLLRAAEVREIRPEPLADLLQGRLDELGPADVPHRLELLRKAQAAHLRPWTRRLAAEMLAADPKQAQALQVLDAADAQAAVRAGRPALDLRLARAMRRLMRLESGAERRAAAADLRARFGTDVSAEIVERMAASVRRDRGLQENVPLRLDADGFPGAHYALYVPEGYDPLEPRPLLVALHGGGILQGSGSDVRGSPKDALAFYLDGAKRLGWLLLCPQALEAPWTTSRNLRMLDATLEEVETLWNVDLERVHLAGQGGGADGVWAWAQHEADRFASVSVAAGGKPVAYAATAGHTALWIYHGAGDAVVPVDPVRKAAEHLLRRKAEFVYCELPKQGHGFPPAARRDMFRSIAPKRRRRARDAWPRASFAQPVGADALKAFGDPAAAWGGSLPEDADGPALVALLGAGRSDAEPAARRLAAAHAAERATLAPDVRAAVADKARPANARIWAAWLCGAWRDPGAVDVLGNVLRAGKEVRLLRQAALAVGRIGSQDSVQDLRWALSDVQSRYRALPGRTVPYQEFARACRLGAAVVEALGRCARSGEDLFADIEESLVRRVLMDRRRIVFVPANGENPSEPRSELAGAVARAYARLKGEKTLFDMLRAAVRGDAAAEAAVRRGMRAR